MSVSLSSIPNSYIRNFPDEVPIKAAQSFVVTAVINLIVGQTAKMAVLGGTIAMTATLIEAITRPIIRGIFPDNDFIAKSIQICVPAIAALGLATALAPTIGLTYKVSSFLLSLLAWLTLNNNRFYERNVAMVEVL